MGNAQEPKHAALHDKKNGNSAEMHLGREGCSCFLFLFQAVDAVTLQCAFPEPMQLQEKHPFYANAMLFDGICPEGLEIPA